MAAFKARRSRKDPSQKENREAFFHQENNTHRPFFASTSKNSVQAKLKIGKPGNALEKEADSMADSVVKNGKTPLVQAKEAETIHRQGMEEEEAQAKSEPGSSTASHALTSNIRQTKGQGNVLPAKTQIEMETAFGVDFSDVKLHTDRASVEMNRDLKSQAFTQGKDIYFNQGKFNPESDSGKHLLAHELTHVVQQNKTKTNIKNC